MVSLLAISFCHLAYISLRVIGWHPPYMSSPLESSLTSCSRTHTQTQTYMHTHTHTQTHTHAHKHTHTQTHTNTHTHSRVHLHYTSPDLSTALPSHLRWPPLSLSWNPIPPLTIVEGIPHGQACQLLTWSVRQTKTHSHTNTPAPMHLHIMRTRIESNYIYTCTFKISFY